jgi:Leucine-rich repeat (LRR) protein
LFAVALTASPVLAAVPQSQRDALIAIYDATGGDSWVDRTGWKGAPGTECTWYGVGCNTAGDTVTTLSLERNHLSGALPAAIGSFPGLTDLYLQDNHLTGAVPPAIGSLANLRILSLDSNQFSGPLPPQIGNATSLQELSFRLNGITDHIPPEIGQLVNLTYLSGAGNQLTGSIPGELRSLTKLRDLYFGGNQLSGPIPADLGSLTMLERVHLDSNQLSGPIPTALGNLQNLVELDFSYNQLSGAIPRELLDLPKIAIITLIANQLEGTLDDIPRANVLQQLRLGYNRINGQIPPALRDLAQLNVLNVEYNQLSGVVPVALADLKQLTHLELAGNTLTGAIPPELGSLPNLERLSLGGNDLGGTIPPQLGNLSALESLELNGTGLEGEIPASLRNLRNLRSIELAGNDLSGPFPEWIGELTELSYIYLGGNALTGVIPPSIGNLVHVSGFYIGSNRIGGGIPREMGNMRALGYLDMSANEIGGPIPAEFWTLTDLVEIRLNDLHLTGSLSPEIANLQKADVLLLGNNDLEGSIPKEIGELKTVRFVSLGGNRLTGPIPDEIGGMTNLQGIDLSRNALQGRIPASMTALTSLIDDQSNFRFNALFAPDTATREFLERKQGPDLHATQTLAPENVRVAHVSDRSVIVEWDPIAYRDQEGGYTVAASTAAGGAPEAVVTTSSKDDSTITVAGLQPLTTYFLSVTATTYPDAGNGQKNVVISDPSPTISTTTTARPSAPPQIVVTETTNGLVQIDGVARNDDIFILTNFGDVATSITFTVEGSFFTFTPASFTLEGGASQPVTVRSVIQPVGSYYGRIIPQGLGAGTEDAVDVTLLSVTQPSGNVTAEPLTTRVEVSGEAGTETNGSVDLRNSGTGRLTGIVLSDQPWVEPDSAPLVVEPGALGTIHFRVIRSKRPEGVEGALTANLSLVYAGGSGPGLLQVTPPGGISTTLVTIVDTTRPRTSPAGFPALGAGEVAFFAPGMVAATNAAGRVVSDLSLANTSASLAINDVRLFFTPANTTQPTEAALSPVGSAQSVTLANVHGVYGTASGAGSLQIRSAVSWSTLAAHAKLINFQPEGTFTGDIPLFRSDRSAGAGEATYLAGVRKNASQRTDVYLQETSGAAASARVEWLAADGTRIGEPQVVPLSGFGMSELADAAPAAAITAVVTNEPGSAGRVAAYARVMDTTGGDSWSIVDWSRVQRFGRADPVRVPLIDGAGVVVPRRRRAVGGTTAQPAARPVTDLTLFNPGATDARVQLDVVEPNGRISEREVVIQPRRTMVVSDAGRSAASTLATAVVRPLQGQVVVTARSFRTSSASHGAAVPVVGAGSGLRLGQTLRFSNLDDSTAQTVAAGAPGTFRTSFGFVETYGQPVTVRASMLLDLGRSLASAVLSREFQLAPGQQIVLPDLVKAIIGEARERDLGELHNLQLQISVKDGRGAVVPFVVVTDNGSGDTFVRLQ